MYFGEGRGAPLSSVRNAIECISVSGASVRKKSPQGDFIPSLQSTCSAVGGIGIEPMTSVLSGQRSTTELAARASWRDRTSDLLRVMQTLYH